MLSEISRKDKYCVISLMGGAELSHSQRQSRGRGQGLGEGGSVNRDRVSGGEDEKFWGRREVLEMTVVMAAQPCKCA